MFPIWLLGVLLAVTASVISNLGLNLQKRAHMNMEAKKAKEREEKLERLGLTGAGSGRNRTSSMSTSGGPQVSFSPSDTPTPTGAEKPVNPLSPTGILKGRASRPSSKHARNNSSSGIGGGTAKGEYHLMDTAPELEDAQVARDEERRQEAAAAATATTTITPGNGLPVSDPLNITPPPADSPQFHPPSAKSYTSLHEIAQGGIDLDNFGVKKQQQKKQQQQNGTSSNGQKKYSYTMVAAGSGGGINGSNGNGRARASSAAGYQPHSTSRNSNRHTSRSSRRRGSAVEGGSGAQAEGAEREPRKKKESYTKQPLWVVGLCCVIGGSLFDFAALAFVDQAVVAPLGSLTLVSNVFFSPCLLKEKVNRKQLYCTFLIIAGSCLAVAFAPHSNATPDIEAMFDNFARMRFIAYAVLVVSSIIFLRLACYRLNKLRRNDFNGAYVRMARYHTFCYAAMAGIMGAQSVLFAKCTAMLLAASIAGDGLMFVYWGTYFVLLGLGVTIFLQIRWLNSGLRMFSALLIVPIFQSFWITVSVIAGMIFFGEYEGVFGSYVNGFLFPFGLILTVCGVYFLTRIATPGMAEAEAAAHRKKARSGSSSTGSTVRRLSASTNNANNMVVPSPAHAAHASVAINGADGEPLPVGTSSSPLLQPQVGYGVPQSPRDPTPLSAGRRARPPPLNNNAGVAAAGAKKSNRDSLDRSVDVGSYDDKETGEEYLHPPSRVRGDEETGDGLSGSDSDASSDDSGNDAESSVPYDKNYVMHSMAPLNFPAQFLMKYLPSALVADEPDTPRAYFEENSSGFAGPGDISLGGLPYANIFRVREEGEQGAAGNNLGANGSEYSYDRDEDEDAAPVVESSLALAANNASAKRAYNNSNGNGNGGIQTIQVQPAPVQQQQQPQQPLTPTRPKKNSSASPSPNYSPRHVGGEGASHASTLSALSAMSPPSAFVGSADFSAASSASSQQQSGSANVIDLSSIEAAPHSFSSDVTSSSAATTATESGALLSAASANQADFGAVDDSDSAAVAALNNSGGGSSASVAADKKKRPNNKKNRKKGAGQLDESLL